MIRAFMLVFALLMVAADWPQFRGPAGSGIAVEAKPVTTWSATENIAWKTKLPGPGSSSPIIVGERVYITCYTGYGVPDASDPANLVRHLVALDRATGKILWTADVPSKVTEDPYRGFINEHGYASHTPAADDQAVYCFFGKSGVVAFDFKGAKLWQTSVGTESDIRGWGSSASPILFENLVIVNAASESRAIVALDKKTGKEIWKADGKKLSLSFSTPALVKKGDSFELVVAMPGEVWGLNPATGKQLWFAAISPNGNISPSVVAGDGVAFITGGFQTKGSLAMKIGGTDDAAKNIAWTARHSSYVPTPVLHNGKLFCVADDGMASATDAVTGKLIYEDRLSVKGSGGRGSKPFYASPIFADGKLYTVSRRNGAFVLKAGDKFEQIAANPPLDDSDFNATPAIIGNQLFLRSNQSIYCLAVK